MSDKDSTEEISFDLNESDIDELTEGRDGYYHASLKLAQQQITQLTIFLAELEGGRKFHKRIILAYCVCFSASAGLIYVGLSGRCL